jgi:hypothetical protein
VEGRSFSKPGSECVLESVASRLVCSAGYVVGRCPFVFANAVTRAAKNAVGIFGRDGPAKRRANRGRVDLVGWPRHFCFYGVSAEGARRFLRTVSTMLGALL